jgi:hypothetical protein
MNPFTLAIGTARDIIVRSAIRSASAGRLAWKRQHDKGGVLRSNSEGRPNQYSDHIECNHAVMKEWRIYEFCF